ncbi:DMT family transporter [Desulfosarcina cetonica]|uniref:DMT family transporter n=1 Tax=Desulfosarcina cetonica TaxID=90730 RepID=UPI0006D054E0|nr:DMT family transporter [Desulfosarcina cetonica]
MDRTTAKGVLLILLATLCIVLMNTCAKASSVSHGPVEMVFYRGVVALFLLVPYMLANHPVGVFKTRRAGAHLYRSIIGNIGVGLVFWAYALLPMANATALLFSAPCSSRPCRRCCSGNGWMGPVGWPCFSDSAAFS